MANDFWERYKHPKWQEKKASIIARDGWICQRCYEDCRKTGKTVHVHHGYYRRNADPWEYPEDTLFTLCEDCHETVGDAKHDVHLEVARFGPHNLESLVGLLVALRELRDFDPSPEQSYEYAIKRVLDCIEDSAGFPFWSAFMTRDPLLNIDTAIGIGVSA